MDTDVQQQTQEEVKSNRPSYSLSDFNILTTLGTGTFGRVRMAKLKGHTTPYAIKMLKKSVVIKLKQVEHIKNEKEILEQTRHPYIITLHATFQDETYVYMLFEYICGGELFSRLRKEGRFSNDIALFYTTEIVLVFEYLHQKGISYRDLKPENLLIDRQGHIKITDFGFAKYVQDRTYTLCGTPEYLAPEIIQSKGHGMPVDWWALGILIYEMIAGFPPFYDESPFGIYQRILSGRIEFGRVFNYKAKDLIKKLLQGSPRRRYGCRGSGANDVKRHKWFKGVDWDMVYNRQIPPPWIPQIKKSDDTHYFDRYPESKNKDEHIQVDQALFDDF